MSEAEKKVVSSDPSLELEPVNMYVLFARMFADIAREVEADFGEAGIQAVRRGRDIAHRAEVMGHANDAEHYLSCYDMGRTDYFYSEDDVKSHSVEQVFTKCVFAKTWTDDGDEKYGIHYCQIIDPAIACGYNEHLKCTHDKHFFKDGQCHFLFEMQDEK